MDGRRHNQVTGLLFCCSLITASAYGGNGNFERTVGANLARLTTHDVRDEALPDSPIGVRLHCGSLCENPVRLSKQLNLKVQDTDRLDRRLRSNYRQLGERLASKLWDDPAGRRVKFDIEGRPGIGLEIPFE